MNEWICKECGTVVVQGAAECPSCGCPVEEAKIVEAAVAHNIKTAKKFPIMPVISLLLGIGIIFMGITVMNRKADLSTYNTKRYAVDSAAFGADFYTEIYKASDTIVDELNDISGGVEVLSESAVAIANVIYYPIGMVIVALGLSVIASSCNHMKKENT